MLKEINSAEFAELTKTGVVLVDFFSATCGPCKMLSFVLGDVEKAMGDQVSILKVHFDENKDLVEANGVKGYPTLIFLKDGVEVKRMQGLQQKPAIVNQLQSML